MAVIEESIEFQIIVRVFLEVSEIRVLKFRVMLG